jgi:hypothetical protein
MQEILDWSEAWALLIPLIVLLLKKPSRLLFPVACYVWIGLLLNIAQNSIWKFAIEFPFSSQPGDNIFIYHTHSIMRCLLLSWFYINLRQSIFGRLIKFLPMGGHLVFDVLSAFFLIALPWVFPVYHYQFYWPVLLGAAELLVVLLSSSRPYRTTRRDINIMQP